MPLSTQKTYNGPFWPLGAIIVANNGTPVNIMSRVDANNNNAPETNSNTPGLEYTPTAHKIFLQGFHPGNSNNGMVVNSGYVYVMMRAAGNGSGNRTDSGSMLFILAPGGTVTLPGAESQIDVLSPYQIVIDADTDGDGALCSLQI